MVVACLLIFKKYAEILGQLIPQNILTGSSTIKDKSSSKCTNHSMMKDDSNHNNDNNNCRKAERDP